MTNPLTREEALAFREKYRRMGDKHLDWASRSPAERAEGFLRLMQPARELGWLVKSPRKESEEQLVYQKWALIKTRVGA